MLTGRTHRLEYILLSEWHVENHIGFKYAKGTEQQIFTVKFLIVLKEINYWTPI